MKRVCVYCGSSSGNSPLFETAAEAVGQALAARGLALVYGGGSIGLMGRIADATLAAGGHVIGVIPAGMVHREVAHLDLPDLHIVATMHERKARMADLADAFVALPGGLGTLDEMFEMLTWAQLGLHAKPCAFLNVDGYFTPLLAFLDGAVSSGFVKPDHRRMFLVDDEPDRLLTALAEHQAPKGQVWLDPMVR